jgi:hypothetical protein
VLVAKCWRLSAKCWRALSALGAGAGGGAGRGLRRERETHILGNFLFNDKPRTVYNNTGNRTLSSPLSVTMVIIIIGRARRRR